MQFDKLCSDAILVITKGDYNVRCNVRFRLPSCRCPRFRQRAGSERIKSNQKGLIDSEIRLQNLAQLCPPSSKAVLPPSPGMLPPRWVSRQSCNLLSGDMAARNPLPHNGLLFYITRLLFQSHTGRELISDRVAYRADWETCNVTESVTGLRAARLYYLAPPLRGHAGRLSGPSLIPASRLPDAHSGVTRGPRLTGILAHFLQPNENSPTIAGRALSA